MSDSGDQVVEREFDFSGDPHLDYPLGPPKPEREFSDLWLFVEEAIAASRVTTSPWFKQWAARVQAAFPEE